MSNESTRSAAVVKPPPDIDFDVCDPNGWYRYVTDSLVLTGLARRSGETYAREIRILVQRFGKPPFQLSEADVRAFILERHKKLNTTGSSPWFAWPRPSRSSRSTASRHLKDRCAVRAAADGSSHVACSTRAEGSWQPSAATAQSASRLYTSPPEPKGPTRPAAHDLTRRERSLAAQT